MGGVVRCVAVTKRSGRNGTPHRQGVWLPRAWVNAERPPLLLKAAWMLRGRAQRSAASQVFRCCNLERRFSPTCATRLCRCPVERRQEGCLCWRHSSHQSRRDHSRRGLVLHPWISRCSCRLLGTWPSTASSLPRLESGRHRPQRKAAMTPFHQAGAQEPVSLPLITPPPRTAPLATHRGGPSAGTHPPLIRRCDAGARSHCAARPRR